MRSGWLFVGLLLVAASAVAQVAIAQVKVPRPAPEFQIAEPSGRSLNLSSYRGKVVLLAFVLTTCAHCQAASKDFEKLQGEFGARGFRAAEVAFDNRGDVQGYIQRLGLTIPVGRGERHDVLGFLGIPGDVRVGTPQVVLIDRSGMIRAQSAAEGSPQLQSIDVLRGLVAALVGMP